MSERRARSMSSQGFLSDETLLRIAPQRLGGDVIAIRPGEDAVSDENLSKDLGITQCPPQRTAFRAIVREIKLAGIAISKTQAQAMRSDDLQGGKFAGFERDGWFGGDHNWLR